VSAQFSTVRYGLQGKVKFGVGAMSSQEPTTLLAERVLFMRIFASRIPTTTTTRAAATPAIPCSSFDRFKLVGFKLVGFKLVGFKLVGFKLVGFNLQVYLVRDNEHDFS
jgi:hypothetical protein